MIVGIDQRVAVRLRRRRQERPQGAAADSPGDAAEVLRLQPGAEAAADRELRDRKPALSLSRGLDRDRGVDETGDQIAVFGRLGSRPLNLQEMRELYLDAERASRGTVTRRSRNDHAQSSTPIWHLAYAVQPAALLTSRVLASSHDYKHLGVASCATSVCHGKLAPAPNKHVALNEYQTWTREDRHAQAYRTLELAESKRIAANLGLPSASTAKICLDCHADNVPQREARAEVPAQRRRRLRGLSRRLGEVDRELMRPSRPRTRTISRAACIRRSSR